MERTYDPNYVWYRINDCGNEIGFPKDTLPNQPGLGWYKGEHFKNPDGSVKEVLGGATLIKEDFSI